MRLVYIQQTTEIEIQSLKEEMEVFKEEMQAFKGEMKEFKGEMKQTVQELKEDQKKRNKQWGELANKLGTVVEDIVAPAVSLVIKKYFKCEVDDLQVRRRRRDIKTGLRDEFDVIAVSETYGTVFLIEVKASVRIEYINEFRDKKIDKFLKLFPEYRDYKLVPIFASLRLEEDIINYLTKNKIYAMAYKEWEYMDILNYEDVNEDR